MSILGWIFIALLGLGGIVWLINKKYVQTTFQVAKANLGEAARDLEAKNALKLMRQGIDECTDQARKAKSGLVKVQGTISGLERQVKAGATEEARLKARIQQAMEQGKQDTDPVLVQLATTLKRTREDLKTNREQLEGLHSVYNDLLSQLQSAQSRGEALEREAESLGVQLDASKLNAELADFANAFDAKGINTALDGVAKYRDLVRKQIDTNNARRKVNKDLGSNTQAVQAFEDHQDAKDILAELRANNG